MENTPSFSLIRDRLHAQLREQPSVHLGYRLQKELRDQLRDQLMVQFADQPVVQLREEL